MQKTTSSRGALRASGIGPKKRIAVIVEPPEEVFREMLLAGFRAIRGMEIDDVFPANQTAGDEIHR
jgi:hypothetical protein